MAQTPSGSGVYKGHTFALSRQFAVAEFMLFIVVPLVTSSFPDGTVGRPVRGFPPGVAARREPETLTDGIMINDEVHWAIRRENWNINHAYIMEMVAL